MISQDIKLLIENTTTDFLKKHKGKLALGALGLAGVAGYAANPEFANDVDDVARPIIKPIVKGLRHAGLMGDTSYSNVATDRIDNNAATAKYIQRLKNAAESNRAINKAMIKDFFIHDK